jgi:phosphoribosylformylglycinamidine cyclo-ligase
LFDTLGFRYIRGLVPGVAAGDRGSGRRAERMQGRTGRGRSAYAAAGVDIDRKMAGIAGIKRMARRAFTPGVLSDLGLFGGLFASPGRDCALVASTDGVGTKLKVAALAGRHDTVGQDLVNHCVNDILVQGARPLFFLDYIGTSRFDPAVFRDVVAGLCKACRENGCALLGGETAELPGLYPPGEYDLVGTIVGAVKRHGVVDGRGIRAGDVILGLPSSGLHTNGYSLARKVLFETAGLGVRDRLPGTNRRVGEALLAVHRSYLRPVQRLMAAVPVRGMAHITGGGFPDNIPRILPGNVDAVIDRAAWRVPPLFEFLARTGKIDRDEMYRVFNMGIGYIVVVREADAAAALRRLREAGAAARPIGRIRRGARKVILEH